MCQITEVLLAGKQWDATGAPTALEVSVRLIDCQLVDIEIFRTSVDTTPLFSASGVGSNPVPETQQRLATHSFVVISSKAIQCGEVLWARALCSTDRNCMLESNVRVECKGFDGSECPGQGPAVDIQPSFDPSAECLPAGSYTATIAGTWPPGTIFSWKLGNFPPGSTTPTGNHTNTFTHNHTTGSTSVILIAEVQVPGCEDVESVIIFPPAQEVTCPDAVTFEIVGPGLARTVSWSVGQPPISEDNLPPGNYTIRVISPANEFEWFQNNTFVPTGSNPNELQDIGLVGGTEITVALRVEAPCCTPLLATIVLSATAVGDGTDGDNEQDNDEQQPPPPPPPTPFCAAWGVIVGIALIAALLSILVAACIPFSGTIILFSIGGITAALVVAILLLLICGPDWCRIFGVITWALKWSIAFGVVIAAVCLSITSLFLVLVLGMIVAAIIWWLVDNNCPVPLMLSWP